jgi:hypothetical protein
MWTRKKFPWISTLDEETDNGGGQGEAVQEGVEPQSTAINIEDEIPLNEAWNPALQSIPEEFHPHLKQHFSQWDKNFQKVQQQFAPYKEFAELGVESADINRGMQLLHILNTNPRGLYDMMGQQFQFVQPEPNKSQGQQESQSEEFELSDFPEIEKHPKFVELQQKYDSIAQQAQRSTEFISTFQQREMQTAAENQIQREVNEVKAKYGDSFDIAAVGNMALGMQQRTGKHVSLMEAAAQLASFATPQQRASDTAPSVIRTGNRGFQTPVNPPKNADERISMIARYAEEVSRQNG